MKKRLKKFYRENRVFSILMLLVAVCLVSVIVLLIDYFFIGGGKSKYGSRLDNIKKVQISEKKQTTIMNKLKDDKLIDKAVINITGKIVYVYINYTKEATLDDAKSKAVLALDDFSDEEKKLYDFQFIIYQKKSEGVEGFTIMGAKNISGSSIVWNNNTPISEE